VTAGTGIGSLNGLLATLDRSLMLR